MAGSMDISAVVSKQDMGDLRRQMARNSQLFGKSLGSSVRFAAWSVASSLKAMTKTAPQYRRYTKVKEERRKRGSGPRTDSLYEVRSDKGGVKKTTNVRAASVAELKKSPKVRIKNKGLAAAAWLWAQGRLGSRKGSVKASPEARSKAQRFGTAEMKLKSQNPSVTVTNKLDYASDAFRGGAGRLDGVMERAAQHMARTINGKLAKAMKAA